MRREIHIPDIASLPTAAGKFIEAIDGHRLVAFDAPMGAGKTTFISAVCTCLGVHDDAVSSPTFAIVNEYRTGEGGLIYHFDFYRIDNPVEALDIGLYDYFDSGSLCFMEWPGNIRSLLPPETLMVGIVVNPDGSRTITWEE